MKGDRIFALFALTWLFYVGSHGQEEARLQCEDQRVFNIVDFALLEHNKGLTAGGQLALYQVLEATKAQNETGEIMSVHFTVRESDCPAGGDKVWHQCDYLQDHSRPSSICHTKVLLKETNELLSHECSVETPIVPDPRPPCLGCPIDIDVQSEDIRESLSYSLSKANTAHNHTHFFILNTISSATRQVIAGFRYRLQFDMQKSNCSKSEFKEMTEECHADENEKTFINCNSTVDVAPWRHEMPETHVQCASGPLPGARFVVRRRPPGWSPLRNIHNFMVVTPTKPPKKDESSEESQESKAPTGAPTAEDQNLAPPTGPPPPPKTPRPDTPATPTASTSCPSKPWKAFNPVIASPPRPRPPPPPPKNKTEGGLVDADLLA
ncbi:kininogen-1 [Pygocentrus nattereri]|nr:kininogen-1 [Pygocentrus nattereri]